MKKAVVTFTVDEETSYRQTNVDKDDDFRDIELLSAIGCLYADITMECDEVIGSLSAMIEHISHKTDKGWRELLGEIKERMEEVDG